MIVCKISEIRFALCVVKYETAKEEKSEEERGQDDDDDALDFHLFPEVFVVVHVLVDRVLVVVDAVVVDVVIVRRRIGRWNEHGIVELKKYFDEINVNRDLNKTSQTF